MVAALNLWEGRERYSQVNLGTTPDGMIEAAIVELDKLTPQEKEILGHEMFRD